MEKSKEKPFWEAEDCESCGCQASECEYEVDQDAYICPNCGGVQ